MPYSHFDPYEIDMGQILARIAETRYVSVCSRTRNKRYRLSMLTTLPPSPFFPKYSDLIASGKAERLLHEQAASAAQANFGNKVFVRAVVEVSNFCRQNCVYCGMRRENRALD